MSTILLERVACDKDLLLCLRFADDFNFIFFCNFSQTLHVGYRKRTLSTSFFSDFALIRFVHKRNKWDWLQSIVTVEKCQMNFSFLDLRGCYLEEHEWWTTIKADSLICFHWCTKVPITDLYAFNGTHPKISQTHWKVELCNN